MTANAAGFELTNRQTSGQIAVSNQLVLSRRRATNNSSCENSSLSPSALRIRSSNTPRRDTRSQTPGARHKRPAVPHARSSVARRPSKRPSSVHGADVACQAWTDSILKDEMTGAVLDTSHAHTSESTGPIKEAATMKRPSARLPDRLSRGCRYPPAPKPTLSILSQPAWPPVARVRPKRICRYRRRLPDLPPSTSPHIYAS